MLPLLGVDIAAIFEKSALPNDVKTEVVWIVMAHAKSIEGLCSGLPYKAPSALPEFADDCTRYIMKLVTPIFQEKAIPVLVGQEIFRSLFKTCGGDERYD